MKLRSDVDIFQTFKHFFPVFADKSTELYQKLTFFYWVKQSTEILMFSLLKLVQNVIKFVATDLYDHRFQHGLLFYLELIVYSFILNKMK